MRKTKFRAWEKELKKWYYSEEMGLSGFWGLVEQEVLENVCEYVGLKDSKGKEIYEGDIVANELGNQKWEVRYVSNGFVGVIPDEHDLQLWPTTCENIEVIGNIYENPELLNQPD